MIRPHRWAEFNLKNFSGLTAARVIQRAQYSMISNSNRQDKAMMRARKGIWFFLVHFFWTILNGSVQYESPFKDSNFSRQFRMISRTRSFNLCQRMIQYQVKLRRTPVKKLAKINRHHQTSQVISLCIEKWLWITWKLLVMWSLWYNIQYILDDACSAP